MTLSPELEAAVTECERVIKSHAWHCDAEMSGALARLRQAITAQNAGLARLRELEDQNDNLTAMWSARMDEVDELKERQAERSEDCPLEPVVGPVGRNE